MFRIRRLLLFALSVLSLTAIALAVHVGLQEYRGSLEFGALVAIAVLAGCTAYYVREHVRDSQLQNRRARSLAILDELNRFENVQRRISLYRRIRALEDEPWWENQASSDELRAESQWLLGIFEDLALVARSGVADEVLLHDSLCSIVPLYFDLWRPYIEVRRRGEEDPRLYIRLEELAKAWKAGRSLQTGDWLPTLFAPREWEELSRIRKRVIRSRHWVVGLGIAVVPLTALWIAFRLVYCWDAAACGTGESELLCLVCRLDDVIRVALVLAAIAVVWLLFDLFTLGQTMRERGWWSLLRRIREGSRNLSGKWEPERGSGPGIGTVLFASIAVAVAIYLYFFGFETYFDPQDFPDAVVRERPLEPNP
jgi:hypothetical protein